VQPNLHYHLAYTPQNWLSSWINPVPVMTTLFPDRNKVNHNKPVRNCFFMRELKKYLFREGFTWWFWQTRWTPLKTSVGKKMFIDGTHSHVYYFPNSFRGQKAQIPEIVTRQRCYRRHLDETIRKIRQNRFEVVFGEKLRDRHKHRYHLLSCS